MFTLKRLKYLEYQFTLSEIELLEKHGHVLEKFATGRIKPRTPNQERFIQVVKGVLSAERTIENIWMRYIKTQKNDEYIDHILEENEKTKDDLKNIRKDLESKKKIIKNLLNKLSKYESLERLTPIRYANVTSTDTGWNIHWCNACDRHVDFCICGKIW